MIESLARLIFLIHLASTLFMLGVIWFVQIVHYPLFASTNGEGFRAFEHRHKALTTWVVAPPMLLEVSTAVLMFRFRPAGVSTWQLSLGLALLVLIWLSTALVQVPCHEALSLGFDPALHRRLVRTNWVRTAAWSIRGLLVLWIGWDLLN